MRKYLKNPLLQRMAVYALSDGIAKAMPFLVFPIVLSYLTTSEFGIVTNFNVITQVFSAIIGMHLTTLINVEYYKNSQEKNKILISNIFWVHIFISILIFFVIYFVRTKIEKYTGLSFNWQLLALSSTFMGVIFSLYTTVLRLQEKAKIYTYYTTTNSIIGALLTFLFVSVFLLSWQGRIYSIVLTSLLFLFPSVYFLFKGNLILSIFNFKSIKSILKFGIPMIPHTLSFWFKTGFDKLLITSYISMSANGLYSFGASISSIFFILNSSFNSAFVPYLFKNLSLSDETGDQKIKNKLVTIIYLYFLLYFILLFLGYLAIKLIVFLYFDKYIQALDYLPYFLVFNLLNAGYQIFVNFIFYKKETKYLGIITFTFALLQTLFSYIFIKFFAMHGVGMALVLSNLLLLVVIIYLSTKKYKMPWLNFNYKL